MIPPGLLFALGLLRSWLTGGARFSQNGPLQRKALLLNIPESFAFNVLPSQQATFIPVFPRCPPRTAVRFDPDSYGDLALPWDPVHVKVRVRLLRMGSPFPPVLWSSCTQAPLAFTARCSRGSFSQCRAKGSAGRKPHWPSMPDALELFLPVPDAHT